MNLRIVTPSLSFFACTKAASMRLRAWVRLGNPISMFTTRTFPDLGIESIILDLECLCCCSFRPLTLFPSRHLVCMLGSGIFGSVVSQSAIGEQNCLKGHASLVVE